MGEYKERLKTPLTLHKTIMASKRSATSFMLTLAAMRRKNKENCPSIRQDETNRTESKGSPSGKAVENQKDKEGKP